jgi:hypothetical protein
MELSQLLAWHLRSDGKCRISSLSAFIELEVLDWAQSSGNGLYHKSPCCDDNEEAISVIESSLEQQYWAWD